MAVVIPAGFAQATLNYTASTLAKPAATVIGFNIGVATDLVTVANLIANSFETNLRPQWHDSYLLTGVTVVDSIRIGYSNVGPVDGLRPGDLAPPNVTCLMRKNSALRGAAHRGRSYWPGFLNDPDIDDSGGISNARRDTVQTAMDGFFGDLAIADTTVVILHNDGATAPTEVTGLSIESLIATQRRRLR